MADEVNINPSGDDGTESGAAPAQSEAASEPWEEYGFDSAEDMAKEFAKYKDDLSKFKPEARKAKKLESELEKYRKAEEERQAAEMSELEKREAALQKAHDEQAQLQAELEKTKKGIVYERAVADRLSKYADADRELVRELYDAKASQFVDEDELAELLDEIDKKWKAHLDAGGGNRPDVGGGTRGQRVAPASKDGQALASSMNKGGIRGLLSEKYGSKR